LYTIDKTFNDINEKNIVDLGCGCGILGLGASLLGSSYTIGIDVDQKALNIAQQNSQDLDLQVEFILADMRHFVTPHELQKILKVPTKGVSSFGRNIDTVIMNPPFGTKNKGIDLIFLSKAIQIANCSVYSLHKTSTRQHILKKAKEWGTEAQVLAELRWEIPAMHNFHKKKAVDIEVDFIRFDVSNFHID